MALNQREIMALAATSKRQQYGCGDGLNIIVEPAHKGGGKSFEAKYRMKVQGQTKQIPVRIGVFGTKPGQFTLKHAHQKWLEIKLWAKKENRDPRQFGKNIRQSSAVTMREAVDAFLLKKSRLKEHTLKNYRVQLENQVLKVVDGQTLLNDLEWDRGGRQIIDSVIDLIKERGSHSQAERVQRVLAQCFDHAIDKGWMTRGQNPAVKESRDEATGEERHHPTIDWAQVPELTEAINLNRCSANNIVVLSVKFMLMTFLRAGALVRLQWEWYDHQNKIITIPGNTPGLKRTSKTQHIPHHVPVTSEMAVLLAEAQKLGFSQKYIFGSYRSGKYPHLNPESPNNFLINLGYKDLLTAHGWRSVPLTVGQDILKVSHEIIQRQMGHLIGDKVRKAYDNSLMLDERREFMNEWSRLLVEQGLRI
jgi:integrase